MLALTPFESIGGIGNCRPWIATASLSVVSYSVSLGISGRKMCVTVWYSCMYTRLYPDISGFGLHYCKKPKLSPWRLRYPQTNFLRADGGDGAHDLLLAKTSPAAFYKWKKVRSHCFQIFWRIADPLTGFK